MDTKALCKRIKKYADKHPQGYIHIASACGLTDSDTVKAWVRNNRVPNYHIEPTVKFLNSEDEREYSQEQQ